ncbi:MAG: preprotein translocase subunit YajC [Paludibacter sp.]|jgi:preprotein translocase subunit YajC|nr:preprotein translocase subunit YajC [Bacteroidales bacterium]HOG05534.1 preprotein translocase subunit YajC [Paludibacter sp.]HOS45655.1 preprotein translocase subunit YajC [Paludibacter sp.]HPM09779.1 preprotein translocase subunit YajC [Paludibacter sp.]
MNVLSVLLQAQEPPKGGGWQTILMMVLIFAVFYFFMIRPQQKRQKEIRKQRESMKPGDKVVTSGGIYGKIRDIKDDGTVTIEIAENVRIKVDKSSVFLSMQDVQQQQK